MHQICLLAVTKCQEEFPSLHRAMRLLFTSHGSPVWILAVGRVHASATFANKLDSCNVKLERLCEKPQRLKTDLCDIPLLEEWCWGSTRIHWLRVAHRQGESPSLHGMVDTRYRWPSRAISVAAAWMSCDLYQHLPDTG